ncbi:MAG: hypothetical protein DWG79_01480 [Chloroflexi bacterium]|nr:FtsW/RodA/SpoVE family cell cycle protein [Chloroflexota bacterium]MDA1147878.1 FtsW/RodA/SpoVE family cell cycle protein [Chloroflexota bacterium]MQC82527.1 hypothetical protein [Chloroflexota bacterium]MQC83149.1 hypothetical protein [Chloroflexota bacterium]
MTEFARPSSAQPHRVVGDPLLLLAALVIGAIGLLSLQGSTGEGNGSVSPDVARQGIFLIVGLLVLITAARFDYRLLRLTWAPLLLAGIALLALVLAAGSSEYGARRWFVIGAYSLQPSEFARLATVLAIAATASSREAAPRGFALLLIAFLVPAALILVEPDLGSALVLGSAWLALMIAWPVSARGLWAIAATVVSFIPLAFALAVPGYQRERLAVFLDPDRDPLGSGFTLRQVEVALGGGGVTGRGLELASSALDGLSTRSSDFALAQIGEQLGLVGTLAVLLGFAVIAWRGLAIAESAPDRFGQLLAVGITALLVVQALLHVAVNVRLFPATGIPLPLISLGGSSMVAACAMIGILLSIASRRHAGPLERWSAARWD